MEKKIQDLPGETWKPVPGFAWYEASNAGRIRSLDRYTEHSYGGKCLRKGKVLSIYVNSNGYMACGVTMNGKTTTKPVHRLVALAWIDNPNDKATVNHLNGDKLDNRPENLEWATVQENVQHAWNTGLNGKYERSQVQLTAFVDVHKIPVVIKDFRTNEEQEFESINACARALKVTQSCISWALIRGNRIQRRYDIRKNLPESTLAIDKTLPSQQ